MILRHPPFICNRHRLYAINPTLRRLSAKQQQTTAIINKHQSQCRHSFTNLFKSPLFLPSRNTTLLVTTIPAPFNCTDFISYSGSQLSEYIRSSWHTVLKHELLVSSNLASYELLRLGIFSKDFLLELKDANIYMIIIPRHPQTTQNYSIYNIVSQLIGQSSLRLHQSYCRCGDYVTQYNKIMEDNQPQKPKGKDAKNSNHKNQVEKQKKAQQKCNQARQLFKRFTKQKNKADAQQAIQCYSQAITNLQSAPNNDKGSTHASYHSERGEAFMAIGHYQKAMYDFGTAIRFDDKNAQYYANRGNCMMMLNQINDALAQFQKAIALKPGQGFFYFNRGLVHARLMNYTHAIQDFSDGLKHVKTPEINFKALFHRGNCYRQIKQYTKSINDLIKACDAVKDDAPAQNNLGLSYFQNQQYDLALQRFKKAIELDPSKATYYNNKALALYHNQLYDQSLAEYNKALALDPNDARTLFNRGNTYLALQKIQQAHNDFDNAIRLMPNNAKFYHSKGLAYQDTKQYEKAILLFKKALQVSNDHIPSLYHLGLMEHKSGKLNNALQSLTKVLNAIGQDRLVYQSRGLVYQDMKNYKKAIQDFDKAAQIERNYAETYYLRGVSKVELGKFGEGNYNDAIQDFLYAEELGSKNAGIFKGIGQAYRLMKDYDKALYYLNQALKRESENQDFLMERSNIYVDIGQFPKAIKDLGDALSRKPTDPKILYKQGLAFYRNRQFKKAIKDLYLSLQNHPFQTYEADIYYHLGISYSNLQMYDKSLPPLTKAIELAYNQPCYIHERAKSYLLTDQFQKSLDDFNEVIKLQPKNSHAYFGRAFALKALKNYDMAAEDLEKAKELDPFNPKLIVNPKKIYEIKCIKLCQPGEQQK